MLSRSEALRSPLFEPAYTALTPPRPASAQWATLQPSPHHDSTEPALVLQINTHGYAYRQRPLSQASRSQRIFYALAKSFAALPKIPPHVAAAVDVPATPTSVTEGSEAEEDPDDVVDDIGTSEEALEKLLSVGGRAGDRQAEREVLQEAEATASSSSPSSQDRQVGSAQTEEPDEMTPEERAQSPTARDFATTPDPGRSPRPLPRAAPRSATAPVPRSSPGGSSSTQSPTSAPSTADDEAILTTPAKLTRRPGFRIEIPPSPASLANAKRTAGTTPSASQPGSPTIAGGGGAGASPMRSPGLKSAAFNFVKRGSVGHHHKGAESASAAATGTGSGSKRSSAASSRASSRASSPVRTQGPQPRSAHHHHPHHERHHHHPVLPRETGPLPPETWPSPFSLPSDPSALPRLHTNLHTRLLPFFGLKLANRRVRVSAYPVLGEGQLYDGCLATKVVKTSATSGGGFKTSLEVRGAELRKWLDLVGNGNGGGGNRDAVDALRVRVVAELLEPDPLVPSVVDTAPFSGIGFGGGSSSTAANAVATAVDQVELDVGIQGEGGEGGGVRIVSDVDDTIKVRVCPAVVVTRRRGVSGGIARGWLC